MSIPFKLETLNGGGVLESVEHCLYQVLDNITDPNTDPKKVRKLTLELKFKPNEHRNMGECEATVKTCLAPQAAQVVPILLDKDISGRVVAAELFHGENHEQHTLPVNVTEFKKTKEA